MERNEGNQIKAIAITQVGGGGSETAEKRDHRNARVKSKELADPLNALDLWGLPGLGFALLSAAQGRC